jgi:aspartokinase-like uncharacterized kinase
MHRHSAPVVLKLGGSLLGLPDLRTRLDGVLHRYAPSSRLLVVGGGSTADLVRDWDRLHGLGKEISHRLALEAMALNARLVAALLANVELVDGPEECKACWRRKRVGIVNAGAFAHTLETISGRALPRSWEVTSDSISAWIAGWMGAERLVLLKSVEAPDDDQLSPGCGLVDPAFSTMCRGVRRVVWINLRAETRLPRELRFS